MTIYCGEKIADDRGSVSFVNDFNFDGVKRFYVVRNHQAGFVRAWHGHKFESKYVTVIQGAAIVQTITFDAQERGMEPFRWVLSGDNPKVLLIPAGNYNGFKTLTDDTIVMFFSTSTLKDSMGDDYRLDYDAIRTDGWKVIPR